MGEKVSLNKRLKKKPRENLREDVNLIAHAKNGSNVHITMKKINGN